MQKAQISNSEQKYVPVSNPFYRNVGKSLKLPPVLSSNKLPKDLAVTPFGETTNNATFKTFQKRKESRVDAGGSPSPKDRSVRFYASQAYQDSYYGKGSVLDKEEELFPLEKNNKALQDHFVSMCDKNNQFLYSNSSLSRTALKVYLQKRYCK